MKRLILMLSLCWLAGCKAKIKVGDQVVVETFYFCATGTVVETNCVFNDEGNYTENGYRIYFGVDGAGKDEIHGVAPECVKRLKPQRK